MTMPVSHSMEYPHSTNSEFLQSLLSWMRKVCAGRARDEVYNRRHPKSRYPRHEPRANWPRGSPNAGTHVPIRGKRGVPLELEVTYHAQQKHLPIVTIKRAA